MRHLKVPSRHMYQYLKYIKTQFYHCKYMYYDKTCITIQIYSDVILKQTDWLTSTISRMNICTQGSTFTLVR